MAGRVVGFAALGALLLTAVGLGPVRTDPKSPATAEAPASPPDACDPPAAVRGAAAIDEFNALVTKLGAESWEEREEATEAIVAMTGAEVNDRIRARLEAGDLDPERRHRLIDALARRITDRPRGAIGITMDTMRRDGRGVRVNDLARGMPAWDVLRVGDIIERINETPVRSSEELATVVQEMTPGTTVRLRVHRPVRDELGRPRREPGGEVITNPVEVTLTLGSMEQLEQRERFGMNTVRIQTQVQRERERDASRLRSRFGAPATVVRVAGADPRPMATTFAGLLDGVERMLDQVDSDGRGSVSLLEDALRGIEALQMRLGDPAVTEHDRERLALAMRRAALLFSRSLERAP